MCRLYGKLDDVTERNSLVLEKEEKYAERKEKNVNQKAYSGSGISSFCWCI